MIHLLFSRYICLLFNYFPGAATASRVYVDALSRLARQAQLGTWGGSKDVGKFRNFRIITGEGTFFPPFLVPALRQTLVKPRRNRRHAFKPRVLCRCLVNDG